jgi:hypothetical protein
MMSTAAMLGSGSAAAPIMPAASNVDTNTFLTNMINSPERAIENNCNGIAT